MSHPSQARIEANRNNSKHGRGPNTAQGKKRSSQNAIRHGLTGRIVVLPSEDMEVYKAFSKELVDSLTPATPMERQLAQTVADTQWRLNRARTIEDGMLALGSGEDSDNFDARSPEINSALTAARVFRDRSRDFVNLSLYEQRLSRAQKEAFRQLRDLQAERKAAPSPAIEVAKPLTQTAGAATSVSPDGGQPRNCEAPSGPYPLDSAATSTASGRVGGFVYSTGINTPRSFENTVPFPPQIHEKKAA